jgi:ubiquinone/menaquinone biosynthesis C-methylase UbiE
MPEARKVSIADPIQKDLEIMFIESANIDFGDLLEIGCGNGIMTRYFESRATNVKALDISKEMIQRALAEGNFKESTTLSVGDATNLKFQDCMFDTVVIVRVLINMSSRELQSKAVNEAHRVLKESGHLILIEGNLNSFDSINSARNALGRDSISPSPVNLYLDERFFLEMIDSKFSNIMEINSGIYDFLTRVLFAAQSDGDIFSTSLGDLKKNLSLLLNFRDDFDEMRKFSRLKGGIYRKKHL